MQLPPFRLERYFARYEFNVEYMLSGSDCQSFSIAELLALEDDAAERFHAHWLGYTESPGAPSLRRAIAGVYEKIAPEQVLVHSGAEEAIFLLMHALLSEGDHAIVHWPCYQSLTEVAESIGCEVTRWEARASAGWTLPFADLQRALRPRTKLIVVNTPHNPTGWLMPRADFSALCELSRARGIVLFSDEVYRESEHDAASRLPAACDLSEMAVSLGVMSKTYGLPGLRIGWLATRHPDLLDRVAALKDYTTICSSAPSEFLAELALRHRATLAARNLGIIRRNLGVLDRLFTKHADRFAWEPPKAGPIAFPKLLGMDVERFCHDLVTRAGVLLLPGTMFGDTGNHFRIGFGRENMPEAVARLDEYLSSSSRQPVSQTAADPATGPTED